MDLSGTKVGDEGLRSIFAGLKLLQKFGLRRCPRVGDKGLVEIATSLKRRQALRSLDFRGTTGFGNDALLMMLSDGGMHLTELKLANCRQVDSLGLLGLRRDVGTMDLRRLDLTNVAKIRSGSTLLGGFATGCRRLVELKLAGVIEAIDDDALKAFASAAAGASHGSAPLEIVDLGGCHKISALGLGPFCDAVKDTLKKLDVSRCPKLDDAFGRALAPCLQLDCVVMVDCPLISDRGLASWARGPEREKDAYGNDVVPFERSWRPGEPEPKRVRLKLKELTMAAALTGSVDTTARCRVPRYAEPGVRGLVRRCGKFLTRLDFDGAPRVDDACVSTVAKYTAPSGISLVADRVRRTLKADGASTVQRFRNQRVRTRRLGHGPASKSGATLRPRATVAPRLSAWILRGIAENFTVRRYCPLLEKLGVDGCSKVTDDGIVKIGEACPLLERLRAAGCGGARRPLTDASLRALALCPKLKTLDVSRSAVGAPGLAALAAGCPDLVSLKLFDCGDVDDRGVVALFRSCKKLETLILASCDLVTNDCLAHLPGRADRLGTLDLHRANAGRGVSDKALARACRALPRARKDRSERCGLVVVAPCVEKLVAYASRRPESRSERAFIFF